MLAENLCEIFFWVSAVLWAGGFWRLCTARAAFDFLQNALALLSSVTVLRLSGPKTRDRKAKCRRSPRVLSEIQRPRGQLHGFNRPQLHKSAVSKPQKMLHKVSVERDQASDNGLAV